MSGLAMAVLLGTLLGLPFWLLRLFRIIRVSGYWRAVHYMRRGRVLIVGHRPDKSGFDVRVRQGRVGQGVPRAAA